MNRNRNVKEGGVANSVAVRETRGDELEIAAGHYLAMRREIGWADSELNADWQSQFVAAYETAGRSGELRYFVAEIDGAVVGSAVAFLKRTLSGTYEHSPRCGYLANVYVEKAHRGAGVARAMTTCALDWLRTIGCRVVRLQASEAGRRLYESMGFVSTSEMELLL